MAARPIPEGMTIFCLPILWSMWTIGSQSSLTKHHVDRVDLSNTYHVIVGLFVMDLGLVLSLWGKYGRPHPGNSWASCLTALTVSARVWQRIISASLPISRALMVRYGCHLSFSPIRYGCPPSRPSLPPLFGRP